MSGHVLDMGKNKFRSLIDSSGKILGEVLKMTYVFIAGSTSMHSLFVRINYLSIFYPHAKI